MSEELKAQIEDLKKRIAVLQWDKDKNQINPGKLGMLDKLKSELDDLIKQSEE